MADILGVLDGLEIEKAHLCGCSVSANAAVAFSTLHPERCLSICAIGVGHGSVKGAERQQVIDDFTSRSAAILEGGVGAMRQ